MRSGPALSWGSRAAPILLLRPFQQHDYLAMLRRKECSAALASVMSAFTAGELEYPGYAYASYASFSASWFSSPSVSWSCDCPMISLNPIRVQRISERWQFQNGAPAYCGPSNKTAVIAKAAIAAAIKMKSKRSNSINAPTMLYA
jgi:hypothetical protein